MNKEQKEAIDFPVDKNLIISAGAGSGKTYTLSLRVQKIIEEKKVSPSQLLILTFSNNAAHNMKKKILEKFSSSSFSDKMLSSHVQTFDSFMQFLLKKFSSLIDVSSSFSIVDKSIINTQKKKLIDQILDEYYEDEIKREKIKKVLIKHSFFKDDNLKNIIISIYNDIDKLPEDKKKVVLNSYCERYLNKHFYQKKLEELISLLKDDLKAKLLSSSFIEKFFSQDEMLSQEVIENSFKNYLQNDFQGLKGTSFSTEDTNDFIFACYKCLSFDGEDFIKELCKLKKICLNNKNKNKTNSFTNLTSFFNNLTIDLIDIENDYEIYCSFKEDITLILDIIQECEKRLNKFKKTNGIFTFNDISNMVISLLKKDEVINYLRNTYRYVMIDEYQDTNDIQEEFINALIVKKDNLPSCYIFCVGDAKQSIYGFRDSKVELFNAREKEYLSDKDSSVIAMNKNYRSAKKLLYEINHIFTKYMTEDHGGINYADIKHQLQYDEESDPYGQKDKDGKTYQNFGISRIISQCGDDNFLPTADFEILAIIDDIQTKISNRYQIYDKDSKEKFRDCRYSDFSILIRKTADFSLYKRYFNTYKIPLSTNLKEDFSTFNPIIVLRSLLSCISLIKDNKNNIIDLKHALASLARSYIFNKDDNYVQEEILLKDDIKENDIYKSIKKFIIENEEKDLLSVFDSAIDRFKIVENLFLLKDASDLISKIEMLRTVFSSYIKMGFGLDEFVTFLEDQEQYKEQSDSKTVISSDNSVSLMTIHASKGLENKIVYLPLKNNCMGKRKSKGEEYDFGYEDGILFKHFLPKKEDITDFLFSPMTLPCLLFSLKNSHNDPDVDEHVRLFYVALTRAQNEIIIVGDKEGRGNQETISNMLNCTYNYQKIDEKELGKLVKENPTLISLYNNYLSINKETFDLIDLFNSDLKTDFQRKVSRDICDAFTTYFSKQREEAFVALLKEIKQIYLNKLKKEESEDVISKIYGYNKKVGYVNNLEELNKQLQTRIKTLDEIDEDSEEEKEDIHLLNKEDLLNFRAEILEDKKDDEKTNSLISIVNSLSYGLSDVKKFIYLSYSCDEFEDRVKIFDCSKMKLKTDISSEVTRMKNVDDTMIQFTPRISKTASKELKEDIDPNILLRGTQLHRLLELVDFKKKDTSFIEDKADRKLIDDVLNLPLFEDINSYSIYKEYEYFDEINNTNGIIDLLLVKEKNALIIDYKTTSFDDINYDNQLKTYRRNVSKIFKIDEKNIKMYLLSITRCKIRKVE